jgi:divalent metal cation (Fe/Co/Zn/Cd) transporter
MDEGDASEDAGRYDERHEALHRGTRVEWATVVWNLGEFFITVGLGVAAHSLAMIAFGLDSLIEVFASLVVIRYISRHETGGQAGRALRFVAAAFALLAVYLLLAAARSFASGQGPSPSWLGAAYLAVAAVGMFVLARRKQRLARIAGSAPLAAEAALTFLDGCLATGVLVSLLLSASAGLWWADPAAALLVGAVCLYEAVANWREASRLSGDVDDLRQ